MVVRTSSTVWCSEIRRASSRGAEPNTSEVVGASGSGSANQVTKPSMPARATRVIHDRCSASSRRNQWCRASISAMVAVVIARSDGRQPLGDGRAGLGRRRRDLLIPRAVAAIG